MFKKAKVIMLPTNKSNLGYRKDYGLDTLQIRNKPLIKSSNTWQAVNLYITTDDEIKEGDWFIWKDNKQISKAGRGRLDLIILNDHLKNGDIFKIIATTDKSLYQYAMHSEGRIKVGLPQTPQSFIKEYCDKGGIDEILVQYTNGDKNSAPIIDLNNIIIKPIKTSWTRDEMISFILSDDFPFVSPLDYVEKQEAIRMLKKSL